MQFHSSAQSYEYWKVGKGEIIILTVHLHENQNDIMQMLITSARLAPAVAWVYRVVVIWKPLSSPWQGLATNALQSLPLPWLPNPD